MHALARKAEADLDGLTLDGLAALLGEYPEKLMMFVRSGVLLPDGDGRFPIVPSVEAYLGYWQDIIAHRSLSA